MPITLNETRHQSLRVAAGRFRFLRTEQLESETDPDQLWMLCPVLGDRRQETRAMFSSFSRFRSFCLGPDRQYGMRGLNNLSLSCCVNSLLQTLSATWELSDLLEKWESAGEDGHNVPLQLKRVLAAMSSEHPQSAPHYNFLRCLDRNRVPLNVQHDANEVFLAILNFIQQQMDDSQLALQIQELYKVSVESHLQCLDCSSVQTHSSFLLNLHLHVKDDHDSLEGCISSFLEDQELRGINSCFCPRCGRKTPSKRGVKLLSLPRILCVHLKRFRSISGYVRKLDCRVTFPETLDLSQIVGGGLSSDFGQNGCSYTLYAVVVHSGRAAFGHYTAYVRHRVSHLWYYADDSRIQQVSWKHVQGAYGKKYSGTAYMLMYRRASREEGGQPDLSG